ELDRMLAAVRDLGAEEIETSGASGQRVDEVDVDGGGTEWRVVRLARDGERLGHPRVTGAEDHEPVGVAALGEIAIRPGIGRAAAMKVDVRRDHRSDGTARGG